MTSADAQIVSDEQSAIARSAQIYGYTLDSSYTYRQIACPAAPHHLLLAYESTSANGALSRFTAVVRRDAGQDASRRVGNARIVPILRAGTTPFVKAASSPHSIEVFNAAIEAAPVGSAVLEEGQAGRQPLLLRGLCYLAMIGEEPALLPSPSLQPAGVAAPPPTLQFLDAGKIRQIVSVSHGARSYRVWSLLFSPQGRLVSALHQESPIADTSPALNAAAAPSRGPASGLDLPMLAIPAGTAHSGPPPTPQPSVEATLQPAATAPLHVQAAPTSPSPPTVAQGQVAAAHPAMPLPPGHFIPSPPPPPSRFVPDSALPLPPHLPQ